jgi:MioC protein
VAGTIIVLVATMSGTAEIVAESVAEKLSENGFTARAVRMERATPAHLARGGLFLICSSTYGTGDVPDNGQPLYQALCGERPDLSALRYGVICLGDMTYSATFCGGGKRMDKILSELGAQRIGTLMEHDASSGAFPEEMALAWLDRWMPLINA